MPQNVKLVTLSDEDVLVLKRLLDTARGKPKVTPGRPKVDNDKVNQASDVHIARTPAGGIPGNEENTTGTGKIGSTGTGSDVLRDDEPGYTQCDCYKIDEGFTPPRIVPIDGLTKRVYNPSPYPIQEDVWIVIAKLKGGRWVCIEQPGFTGEKTVYTLVECDDGGLTTVRETWSYYNGRLVRAV